METFFGKTWQHWISQYALSHQHPINRFCHKLGIPIILISLPFMIAGIWSVLMLSIGASLFLAGWALQFIGHAFERKWPEFFSDWRFLFVGVRWWWASFRKK